MLASLDPDAPAGQNVLGLPEARRACLLTVDGLGWELLRQHPAAAQAATARRDNDRAFVTGYHGDLDGTGHMFGAAADAWYNQLAHVDKLAEQLAASLPSGACMYVTADHGMVDISPDDKFDVDA